MIEGNETRYVRYPDGHSELIGRGSLGTDPRARGMLITEGGTHIVFQTRNFGSATAQQLEPERSADGHHGGLRPHRRRSHPRGLAAAGRRHPGGRRRRHLPRRLRRRQRHRLRNRRHALPAQGQRRHLRDRQRRHLRRRLRRRRADLLPRRRRPARLRHRIEEVVAFSETGDVTPVNVAPDGTRAYFVSPSVLGEENPNGALAQAGKENLYLSEEGAISFVGTVTDRDVEGEVNNRRHDRRPRASGPER